MNHKGLARHYDKLTPEERFRLIMAAGSRGDEAEGNRLMSAGRRIHFTMFDHSPYAHAFHELMFLTYIELLEDAAFCLECNERTDKLLAESIDTARPRKRKKAGTQRAMNEPTKEDTTKYPAWHRCGRTAYAAGFLFQVKMQGWKLFCEQLNASPSALWEQTGFPGQDRLKRALVLAQAGAAFPSAADMACWLNEVRPAGDPERTEADVITSERFAASLDAAFRERVRWWGGG